MNNQNASKENIDYYQNNVSMTTTAKKVSSSKDTTLDERRQKKQQPVVEIEKPSLNSSTTSLAKIQHLMEKLNEKIALRVNGLEVNLLLINYQDQKVQELQNQAEVSSIADSDILDTSK